LPKVRFDLKATKLLRRREVKQWAKSCHPKGVVDQVIDKRDTIPQNVAPMGS
jgi:hypothetical protein